MMSIEQSQVEPDIVVLHIHGKISAGHSSRELAAKVDELVQAGVKRVIFDLTEATYLDSSGLGIVVLFGGKLKQSGGELRIAGATGPVHTTLKVSKVSEIVSVFETLQQASFGLSAGAA